MIWEVFMVGEEGFGTGVAGSGWWLLPKDVLNTRLRENTSNSDLACIPSTTPIAGGTSAPF